MPAATTVPSTPAVARRHRAAGHHHARTAPLPVPYGVQCQPAALQLAQARMPGIGGQETLVFTLTNTSPTIQDILNLRITSG